MWKVVGVADRISTAANSSTWHEKMHGRGEVLRWSKWLRTLWTLAFWSTCGDSLSYTVDNLTNSRVGMRYRCNLNGSFLCSKAVLPIMKANNFGRIVNMSSSAGRSVSTLGGVHYTAAKAGVLGLTRGMAKEVAPFGITVNAICPGLIDTEMARENCTPEQLRAYEESFPIPRLGTPEEVAQLIIFLAIDAAYITGASIDINGGD